MIARSFSRLPRLSTQSLHTRLAMLIAVSVAVAVVAVSVLAWTAVWGIQRQQNQTTLTADAAAIAAQPQQWLASQAQLPNPNQQGEPGVQNGQTAQNGQGRQRGQGGGGHGRRDLGARWQILDTTGAVISSSALPVTAAAKQVAAGTGRPVQEHVTIDQDPYLMLTVPAAGGGAVQVAINQEPLREALTSFALYLVVACLAGIILAALLGWTVARAGLRPVQRLTEEVEEVTVTMDLTRPIEVSGTDEIARLATLVNTLLAAIETSRRAQRALVEDAGHELRTPLTSIRTNIELLLEVERHPEIAHRLPPEDRARLLGDLEAQVGELATLTTELVELSREETSREDVEVLDLSDVVEAAVARVRIRAPGIAFTTDLGSELGGAAVRGRPVELERMVLNVLDNAAKWSPPGATVSVVLRAEAPDWCTLTVTDSGPGIEEADRPHVFERFYRAPAARAMPGSGLGLAIVAQTAAQHGGTVTVGSARPHGTVITIGLPRDPGLVPGFLPGS